MTRQQSGDRAVGRLLETMLETQSQLLRAVRGLSDEVQESPSEFSVPFRPFFRIGDIVRVIRSGAVNDVVVRFVSALPNYRHDFGQITARNAGNEVAELEVGADRMAQFRFSPVTEFEVELDNPSGVEQWRTSTQRFTVLPWINAAGISDAEARMREVMSQFWVWENNTPRFNLVPLVNSAAHQVEAYADFFGWLYDVTKVSSIRDDAEREAVQSQLARGNFRVIRVNGRPS